MRDSKCNVDVFDNDIPSLSPGPVAFVYMSPLTRKPVFGVSDQV